jgi:hypothetical protein
MIDCKYNRNKFMTMKEFNEEIARKPVNFGSTVNGKFVPDVNFNR